MKKILFVFLFLINAESFGQIKTVNLRKIQDGKKIKQVYKCYTGADDQIISLREKGNLLTNVPGLDCNGSAQLISETVE